MEEYTQITLDQWTQWKEDIRRKLAETASNFVYIGYRLKQIRDSGMYDGAADIFAFAEKEYGLGKSTVSRFIAINEKYSEGGNSLELKKEFKGFSSSKLAEMLTLPDNEIQLITEKTTIREIRELKSFNSQEPKEEDLEAAGLERTPERAPEQLPKRTPLEKCVADYFKTRREIQRGVRECLEMDPPDYKEAAERMAPSGQASHRRGTVFLFLYDWNTGVKYKLMTEPEPVAMSWAEFLEGIRSIVEEPEPVEKEAPVATSQQEKNSEKEPPEKAVPVQENQGKVEAVATSQQEETEPEKPAEEPEKKPEKKPEAAETAEQIPGQDSIWNHPEYVPEEMAGQAVQPEGPEGQQESEKAKKEETGQQEPVEWQREEKAGLQERKTRRQDPEAEKETCRERLQEECTSYIGLIQENLSLQDYRAAEKAARELLRCIQELIEESGE